MRVALAMMTNPLGQPEFRKHGSMTGGTLYGMPVIASDYITKAMTIVVLVNASDIFLADDGDISVDASREASLEMSDAPAHDSITPTGASLGLDVPDEQRRCQRRAHDQLDARPIAVRRVSDQRRLGRPGPHRLKDRRAKGAGGPPPLAPDFRSSSDEIAQTDNHQAAQVRHAAHGRRRRIRGAGQARDRPGRGQEGAVCRRQQPVRAAKVEQQLVSNSDDSIAGPAHGVGAMTSDMAIDRLRLEATQLGIDIDGRWGVARLQHEIAQAKR